MNLFLQKLITNKQNKLEKNLFFVGILKVTDKKAGSGASAGSINQVNGSKDPDLDPYQNVTDPEHWNTVCMNTINLISVITFLKNIYNILLLLRCGPRQA
jgi:hypothetical protein